MYLGATLKMSQFFTKQKKTKNCRKQLCCVPWKYLKRFKAWDEGRKLKPWQLQTAWPLWNPWSFFWKQAPNLAPKQANHLPLTLTSSSSSACICIVLPLNKFFSNFSFPLLETWEATVIFHMVKKCPCPEYLTDGLDLGALWSARKPVTHVVKPRADDAPCMTPGSEHPQELGCAGNSVTSLVHRRGNHQLHQSLVLTLAFSINFD